VNRNVARRPALAPRIRGLALAASAVIVLTALSLRLGAMDRAAWRSVLQPGPASLDQALAALAGTLALVLVIWLLAALVLSLLAALASGTSALSLATADLARLLAPVILRNAVAALLGVAIAASPAAAADAVHPHRTASQSGTAVQIARPLVAEPGLSPAWVPLRKASVAAAGVTNADHLTSAASQATDESEVRADPELLPGWIPGRPVSPSLTKVASTELAPVVTAPTRARVDPDDQIVVRRGETLWDIAARHLGTGATDGEIASEWPHWFTANRAVIGADPDHLIPGERLRAPSRESADRPTAEPVRDGTRGGAVR
jgi:resuscitation-promoting factor RpfA